MTVSKKTIAAALGRVMTHKKERAVEELKDALAILEEDDYELEQDQITMGQHHADAAFQQLKDWDSLLLDLERLDQ